MSTLERAIWTAVLFVLHLLGCIAPTYDLGIESDELPPPTFEALISDPDGRAVHVTLTCDPADVPVLVEGHGWYLMGVE